MSNSLFIFSNRLTMDINRLIKVVFLLYLGYVIKIVELSSNNDFRSGIQLVLNYTNGDISIYTDGRKWFDNTDVIAHQNHENFSQSNGKLQMSSGGPVSIDGTDIIGDFKGMSIDWNLPFGSSISQTYNENILTTQARCYGNDVIAFSQIFPRGLVNTSLGLNSDSVNKVRT